MSSISLCDQEVYNSRQNLSCGRNFKKSNNSKTLDENWQSNQKCPVSIITAVYLENNVGVHLI